MTHTPPDRSDPEGEARDAAQGRQVYGSPHWRDQHPYEDNHFLVTKRLGRKSKNLPQTP